jgi:L-lactate dehydrogenase
MTAKVRICVPDLGDLARAIAEGVMGEPAEVVRPKIDQLPPDGVDVLVLAGEGAAGEVLHFAKSVRRVSPDVVTVAATEGSESLVRSILGELGAGSSRVLGVGAVGFTGRFRALIARRCRVAVEEVQGYVAGNSAGGLVPLWSTAAIGAVPLHHWAVAGHGKLSVRDRIEIFQGAKEPLTLAERTEAAIGVVDAVANDRGRILPVCAMLKEYAGISGVVLSVPHVVNRGGAEVAVNIPLNPAEEAGLRQAGEALGSSD